MSSDPQPPSSTSDASWEAFRQEMPICERWAYFDHAAVAPLPRCCTDTLVQWAREAGEDGVTHWPGWMRRIDQLRAAAARVTSAAPEEIALIPNTTTGISLVAEGYPWKKGDNLVTLANEFPSNLYPWMNLDSFGVEVRRVEVDPDGTVDLDRLRAACDARTRIVSLSWVGYASGYRLDLERVTQCVHDCGALFFLDAIQGLGVFPLNVRRIPIDFFAADGHKWLLGPEGAGLMYIRREHLERLRPLGVGWNSVRHRFDFSKIEMDLREEAARYEGGTMNTAGFLALEASLGLLERQGLASERSSLADRVLDFCDELAEGLRSAGAAVHRASDRRNQSGIVAFTLDSHAPEAVRRALRAEQIIVNCRGGKVRVSPHAYHTAHESRRLVEAVGRLAAHGG